MKSKALFVFLVVAGVLLLIVHLFQSTQQKAPNNVPTNALAEASNSVLSPKPGSGNPTITTNRPPAAPGQSQRENVSNVQGNWASEPLPPGSNLQARLEELARRRGFL